MTAAVCDRVIVFLLAAIVVLLALAPSTAVSFDHYGGAYGVSVGTDTHYCSIETAWPPVTCESAS